MTQEGLFHRASEGERPQSVRTEPVLRRRRSDAFLGPRDPIPLPDPGVGCDLEAAVAVIIGDVPRGADRETALAAIRLVLLVNHVSLRHRLEDDLSKGDEGFQSQPASAFSPAAVTPDALGDLWRDGKLHGALEVYVNGAPLGQADAGVDMAFDFGTLIAHAARARDLTAGAIIGSGGVSNRDADGGPGRPISLGGVGYSCIAELRMVEARREGAPRTPFLRVGDEVRIEMRDERRRSLFGAIEQTVAAD